MINPSKAVGRGWIKALFSGTISIGFFLTRASCSPTGFSIAFCSAGVAVVAGTGATTAGSLLTGLGATAGNAGWTIGAGAAVVFAAALGSSGFVSSFFSFGTSVFAVMIGRTSTAAVAFNGAGALSSVVRSDCGAVCSGAGTAADSLGLTGISCCRMDEAGAGGADFVSGNPLSNRVASATGAGGCSLIAGIGSGNFAIIAGTVTTSGAFISTARFGSDLFSTDFDGMANGAVFCGSMTGLSSASFRFISGDGFGVASLAPSAS